MFDRLVNCLTKFKKSVFETLTKYKIMKKSDEFLSPKEVQGIFGISKPTEISWRKNKVLPKPLIMGKKVLYRSAEINKLKAS